MYFGSKETGTEVRSEQFVLTEDIYRVFLYRENPVREKPLTMNDVRPRVWGWICIDVGGEKVSGSQSLLLFSDIWGEPGTEITSDAPRCVAWLKRQLAKTMKAGVDGGWPGESGGTFYRDILYSDEARRLHDAGVVWKQFVTGRAVFAPA